MTHHIYKVLSEATEQSKVGKTLPKGFHGHPAKMKANTVDALAVVPRKGRPTAMLTMTCNGNWEAIKVNLLPGQRRLSTDQTYATGCSKLKDE